MRNQGWNLKPYLLLGALLSASFTATAGGRSGHKNSPPPVTRHASLVEDGRFPIRPDVDMTPGSLCVVPDNYRYPERIPYCERSVDSQFKRDIIRTYDEKFGHQIQRMNRADFKIDHLIPLCAGGSNEGANLWPQHKSVYELTDPVEEPICRLMAMGRMSQEEAVQLIRTIKQDPNSAPEAHEKLLERLK